MLAMMQLHDLSGDARLEGLGVGLERRHENRGSLTYIVGVGKTWERVFLHGHVGRFAAAFCGSV